MCNILFKAKENVGNLSMSTYISPNQKRGINGPLIFMKGCIDQDRTEIINLYTITRYVDNNLSF